MNHHITPLTQRRESIPEVPLRAADRSSTLHGNFMEAACLIHREQHEESACSLHASDVSPPAAMQHTIKMPALHGVYEE